MEVTARRRNTGLGAPVCVGLALLSSLPLCAQGFLTRPVRPTGHPVAPSGHCSYKPSRQCRVATVLEARKGKAAEMDLLDNMDLLKLVEDEEAKEQREEEGAWFNAVVAWSKSQPEDCLLGNIGSLRWADVCARAQAQYVRDLVEGREDSERVGEKLEALMDSLRAYFMAHTAFSRAVDPQARGNDDLFVGRMRFRAFRDAQSELAAARDRYVEAHVALWSDLAAVVKSQEDIPGPLGKRTDLASKLPAPYGLAKASVVSLPVPPLMEWGRDGFGGVEEQVAAVMLLKFTVLPALQALRRQPSFDKLVEYASALGRLYRKGKRWFGQDPESVEFLTDAWAEWKDRGLPEEDPTSTGYKLQGVEGVSRRGLEDVLLENLPAQS